MATDAKTDPRTATPKVDPKPADAAPAPAPAPAAPAFDPSDPNAAGLPPGVFFVSGQWVIHDGSPYAPAPAPAPAGT